MPLSWYGLWEAEMTTPASKSSDPVRYAIAGVGATPMVCDRGARQPCAVRQLAFDPLA